MEVLFGCLLEAVVLLPHSHHLIEFFSVDFPDVLHHYCDMPWIVLALEFLIVSSVLENDCFAQEAGGRGGEDAPPVFQSFLIVLVVGNHHPEAAT